MTGPLWPCSVLGIEDTYSGRQRLSAAMTYNPRFLSLADGLPAVRSPASDDAQRVASRVDSMWQRVRTLAARMADDYAAATAYEQLSRLSDAELQRRGLSRATLARDVGNA